MKVTIWRQGGTYGQVSVDYKTIAVSANSDKGNYVKFGISGFVNLSYIQCSHFIEVFGKEFLLLCGYDVLQLYQWLGKFTLKGVSNLKVIFILFLPGVNIKCA